MSAGNLDLQYAWIRGAKGVVGGFRGRDGDRLGGRNFGLALFLVGRKGVETVLGDVVGHFFDFRGGGVFMEVQGGLKGDIERRKEEKCSNEATLLHFRPRQSSMGREQQHNVTAFFRLRTGERDSAKK